MQTERLKELSNLAYDVTQNKATEQSNGINYHNFEKITNSDFYCIVCHKQIFNQSSKFNSGCGWPAFSGTTCQLKEETDYIVGYPRTEVMCPDCGAHLGHKFEGEKGPGTLRYCINTVSMSYKDKDNEFVDFQ